MLLVMVAVVDAAVVDLLLPALHWWVKPNLCLPQIYPHSSSLISTISWLRFLINVLTMEKDVWKATWKWIGQ
jgi:hypothetical protein